MVDTPVIPDGEIIRVLPPVADLEIMVINQQPHEPREQRLALKLGDIVHLGHVLTDGKHRLPPGNGVGADDGVDSLEEIADVLGGAARLGVELEAVALGGLVEAGLRVGCSQGLEEALVGCGDAVVELVAGGPEGVYDFISLGQVWGCWFRTYHHRLKVARPV